MTTKRKRFKKPNFKKAVGNNAERSQQEGSNYGYLKLPSGVSIFAPAPGSRVKFDIMPYVVSTEKHPDRYDDENVAVPGALWYKLPFKIHRNIGQGKDAVVCPRTFGRACPICEYREKRLKEGADWEDVKEYRPSDRNLYVIIPKDSKDHDVKPHIMDISHFLFQELLFTEIEEDEENSNFPDLEEGKTLRVRFDSETIGNSKPFPKASRIDFGRRKPYDEEILDSIPDLDEVLMVLSYKNLEAKFMEIDIEDTEEEEEEEEPKNPPRRKKSASSKSSTSKKTKKKKPEPEPEEEEEEDFEDDFEEEEFEDPEEEDDFEDPEEEEFEDPEEEEEDDFEDPEEEEFEDDFEEEEEEEEEEDDFEDDFEEEEEEEEPAPKPKRKTSSKTKKAPVKKRKR